jgi:hypothetical protein
MSAEVWDFRFQRGTQDRWAAQNPILGPGEPGIELDTHRFKMGDGYTTWNDLPYFLNEEGVAAYVEAYLAEIGGDGSDPRIGNLSDLTTDDKSLIVTAINEVNSEDCLR